VRPTRRRAPMSDTSAVLQAASELVDAFARGDLEAYFASFDPDATFLFHTHPDLIGSVAEYRQVWDGWVRDEGFRVVAARSTEPHVRFVGEDVAIFTHRVETRVETHEGSADLHERETIVFAARPDGTWTAVHEHLSPDPAGDRDG
jgi:ketosteroid isomerase-like protein